MVWRAKRRTEAVAPQGPRAGASAATKNAKCGMPMKRASYDASLVAAYPEALLSASGRHHRAGAARRQRRQRSMR